MIAVIHRPHRVVDHDVDLFQGRPDLVVEGDFVRLAARHATFAGIAVAEGEITGRRPGFLPRLLFLSGLQREGLRRDRGQFVLRAGTGRQAAPQSRDGDETCQLAHDCQSPRQSG